MNALADAYADRDVGSIFLYTNEAHPGEYYPHLTSFEQKLRHAQALRDVYDVTRPILVDSLDGACHRKYGSMPNMTWIFNKNGRPLYKSNWTDVASVQNTLDYLLDVQARRRNKERLAPFSVQRIDFRTQDSARFNDGLARSGPKAVTEFAEAFK